MIKVFELKKSRMNMWSLKQLWLFFILSESFVLKCWEILIWFGSASWGYSSRYRSPLWCWNLEIIHNLPSTKWSSGMIIFISGKFVKAQTFVSLYAEGALINIYAWKGFSYLSEILAFFLSNWKLPLLGEKYKNVCCRCYLKMGKTFIFKYRLY